jgi:hypothetical protein
MMSSPTLVIADYPIGYSSGFGETLYNLFNGFPDEKLWTAHPLRSLTSIDYLRIFKPPSFRVWNKYLQSMNCRICETETHLFLKVSTHQLSEPRSSIKFLRD